MQRAQTRLTPFAILQLCLDLAVGIPDAAIFLSQFDRDAARLDPELLGRIDEVVGAWGLGVGDTVEPRPEADPAAIRASYARARERAFG